MVILNLLISLIATVYDFPVLSTVPIQFWFLTAICPVIPLLLIGERRSQALTGLGSIPAAVFGVTAIPFYGFIMIQEGFLLTTLGAVLWVWLYAAQGVITLKNQRPGALGILFGSLYTTVVLSWHFFTGAFGYLGVESLTQHQLLTTYNIGMASLCILVIRCTRPTPTEYDQ